MKEMSLKTYPAKHTSLLGPPLVVPPGVVVVLVTPPVASMVAVVVLVARVVVTAFALNPAMLVADRTIEE